MQSPHAAVPDAVHDLRYRITDLLAEIEAEKSGLDPRTATVALLETAYGAALTFCSSATRARHHVDALVQKIHAGHGTAAQRPAAIQSTPTSRLYLAIMVAVLSWVTVVFLAHRGPVSPWNLLGPVFCTVLALVTAYRFLVSSGFMRPLQLFSRGQRLGSS